MPARRIYVVCPDNNTPAGGIRVLYRHVDILNRHGIPASIVHATPGFRCTWFANDTSVCYRDRASPGPNDVMVLPETLGPTMAADMLPGIRKVIFNQNCYYSFVGYSPRPEDRATAYGHPDVVAAIVVSEDSRDYLHHVFPGLALYRLHHGVDPALFHFVREKRNHVCVMPRKNPQDSLQVLNILKFRGALQGFEFVPIANVDAATAARMLREALVFLSFGHPEGFGLPPAEAMACGCLTIGYHGMGGREFLRPEFAYPVGVGEILEFARTVEAVLTQYRTNPEPLDDKRRRAAEFIAAHYSPAKEEADIIGMWTDIFRRM